MPRTCGNCGEPGHNRRTCPRLRGDGTPAGSPPAGGGPPRVKRPEDIIPGLGEDEDFAPSLWSLTYGARYQHDIPDLWWWQTSQWIATYTIRGMNAKERGTKNRLLHGQAWFEVHFGSTLVHQKKLLEHYKCFIPLGEFDRSGGLLSKVTLKPFKGNQTPMYMGGYVQTSPAFSPD